MMKNRGSIILLFSLTALASQPQATLRVDKTSCFKGEPVIGSVRYMIPKEGSTPQISNTITWSHPFIALNRSDDSNETHYFGERHFLFYPLQGDKIRVAPTLDIGIGQSNDQSYQRFKDISAFDNTKITQFKPNPLTITLKNQPLHFTPYVGQFTIQTKIDATTIKPHQPLHFTVTIQGEGGIDTFALPELKIDHANTVGNVIEEKVSYDKTRMGKKTFGYTITAENNFTIPSLKWDIFDPQTSTHHLLETKPITILVQKESPSQNVSLPFEESIQAPHTLFNNLLYFIVGALSSLVALKLFSFSKKRKGVVKTDEEKILHSKDHKELLALLLPYIHNPQVNETIKELEEYLYNGKKIKIDRKKIAHLLKSLKTFPSSKDDIML